MSSEGIYPGAIWRPGPQIKSGYEAYGWGKEGRKRGEVKHSAEGYWPGAHLALDDLTVRNGRYVHGSWHFTVGYDRVEQHYPLLTHTWHGGDTDDDGGVRANLDLIGVEHLGLAGENLLPYQVRETVKLTQWAAAQLGFTTFSRYPQQDGWTLAEHNQVSSTYTACPSNRIPWIWIMQQLNKPIPEMEDDMAPAAWVRDAVSLKSYVIVGGKKRHVESAEQEKAFLKAKYIRLPEVLMTAQELSSIPDA